jgi:hypothetical protein
MFLAYFIAVIGSYSQLKIVYYFPNPQEKFPIESYKIKIFIKIFAKRASSL